MCVNYFPSTWTGPFNYTRQQKTRKTAKDRAKDGEREGKRHEKRRMQLLYIFITFSQGRSMYSNVSMFCSAYMKDIIKANLYKNLKTEMRYVIMTCVIKICDVLFLKRA